RDGLYALNGGQRLGVSFARSGVAVRSGSSRLSLALVAAGYGGRLRAVEPVAPRPGSDRVSYPRGPLGEWYVNGPLGLEQGFTLARPLPGGGGGPLTLSLAVRGNLPPVLAPGGRALTFDSAVGRA